VYLRTESKKENRSTRVPPVHPAHKPQHQDNTSANKPVRIAILTYASPKPRRK